MEYKTLAECRCFNNEKMQKVPLFESGKMFYDLYCLPLKLLGSDGAPARAVLIQK